MCLLGILHLDGLSHTRFNGNESYVLRLNNCTSSESVTHDRGVVPVILHALLYVLSIPLNLNGVAGLNGDVEAWMLLQDLTMALGMA